MSLVKACVEAKAAWAHLFDVIYAEALKDLRKLRDRVKRGGSSATTAGKDSADSGE